MHIIMHRNSNLQTLLRDALCFIISGVTPGRIFKIEFYPASVRLHYNSCLFHEYPQWLSCPKLKGTNNCQKSHNVPSPPKTFKFVLHLLWSLSVLFTWKSKLRSLYWQQIYAFVPIPQSQENQQKVGMRGETNRCEED